MSSGGEKMKIAIIGGGASGLVCAISAARKAKEKDAFCKITVFESKDRVGKKILATGNGRCNMMNTDSNPFYFSDNNFYKFAIEKFNFKSNLKFFQSMGLYTRVDDEGRVYPLSNQATTVLDFLRNECELLGIKTVTDCEITSIKKQEDSFIVNSNMKFDKVVLACGSKASVKNFNGYDLLKQLGHKVTPVLPSLTKINTKDTSDVKQLQGIRHKVNLSLYCDKEFITKQSGELLFAKYGLSGIVIMQLSAFIAKMSKTENAVIVADFICDMSFDNVVNAIKNIIKHNGEMKSCDLLSGFMPKKLSLVVVKSAVKNSDIQVNMLSEKDIISIARKAKGYKFYVDSLKGFDEAQVASGGADTSFFNSKTMQSKKVRGFYAIGEVLDVDGLCGGYNLMWAWSSGRLCGENLITGE